jgi:hypothetical protein
MNSDLWRQARDGDLGLPEIEFELPCQDCGCHTVFAAVASVGERSNPLFLRCCQCGRDREDLRDFAGLAPGADQQME